MTTNRNTDTTTYLKLYLRKVVAQNYIKMQPIKYLGAAVAICMNTD